MNYVNQITIPKDGITESTATLNIKTISGNRPKDFGNTLFLWQDSDVVPFNTYPLTTQVANVNTKDFSISFNDLDLQNKDYVIAFGLTPNTESIVSYVYLPMGELEGYSVFSSHMGLSAISNNSVVSQYSLIEGLTPKTYGYRIGLYTNGTPTHKDDRLLTSMGLSSDSSNGSIGINYPGLVRNKSYGVGIYYKEVKNLVMYNEFEL